MSFLSENLCGESESVAFRRTVPTVQNWHELQHYMNGYLSKRDRLALLLDFDGTLAPIQRHPSNTIIAPASADILRRLAVHPNVFLAIISGRGVTDVQQKVEIPNITYSGNHGLEIVRADGTKWALEVSDKVRTNFVRMLELLERKVVRSGAWVENKVVSLTFHYREAPPSIHHQLHNEAVNIIEALGYVVCPAHFAIEARPPIHWNKGEAALKILNDQFGPEWVSNTRVVYAGDDTSDEDAMRSLQGRGRSFRVAESPDIQTYADFRLTGTTGVTMLLEWIENTLTTEQ